MPGPGFKIKMKEMKEGLLEEGQLSKHVSLLGLNSTSSWGDLRPKLILDMCIDS